MKGYEEFKKWDPSKGDYTNEVQRERSRLEKRRKKRNKIIFYFVLGIVLSAVVYKFFLI